MELNRQPINLTGQPFVIRPHPERSIYGVFLSDRRRDWRDRFNRKAPTAPDISIHVTRSLIRFEATPGNFATQLVAIRALIDYANQSR
jgi:hypothetical protein